MFMGTIGRRAHVTVAKVGMLLACASEDRADKVGVEVWGGDVQREGVSDEDTCEVDVCIGQRDGVSGPGGMLAGAPEDKADKAGVEVWGDNGNREDASDEDTPSQWGVSARGGTVAKVGKLLGGVSEVKAGVEVWGVFVVGYRLRLRHQLPASQEIAVAKVLSKLSSDMIPSDKEAAVVMDRETFQYAPKDVKVSKLLVGAPEDKVGKVGVEVWGDDVQLEAASAAETIDPTWKLPGAVGVDLGRGCQTPKWAT